MKKLMKEFKKVMPLPPSQAEVDRLVQLSGDTLEQVQKTVAESLTVPMFENNYYTVLKRFVDTAAGPMWHLSIRRNDRKPIHDWTDLQTIKNMLVGPEHEGVELYPAESRLLDAENQYHLWVFMSPFPEKMFPFGTAKRVVVPQK